MTKKTEFALLNLVRRHAGELTKKVKALAPNHLKSKVSTSVSVKGKGKFELTIRVRGKDARAQEWGSGIRSVKYKGSEYLITPKKSSGKKLLAFYWEYANPAYHNFLPDGRVTFGSVTHPGIHPFNNKKGYVRPAIKEYKIYLRREAPKELKQAILGDIKTAFTGVKK